MRWPPPPTQSWTSSCRRRSGATRGAAPHAAARVVSVLGAAHPVAKLAATIAGARDLLTRAGQDLRCAASSLVNLSGRGRTRDVSALAPYPLIARKGIVEFLDSNHLDDWLDYIVVMDRMRAGAAAEAAAKAAAAKAEAETAKVANATTPAPKKRAKTTNGHATGQSAEQETT